MSKKVVEIKSYYILIVLLITECFGFLLDYNFMIGFFTPIVLLFLISELIEPIIIWGE